MWYYDNFWHIDAHKNIPSPACLIVFVKLTRKPSYRWQTRATRKPAEIASIRCAYNVVVDNTGRSL